MNVFDFVNAINYTKENLFENDPLTEREYVPFIVNRSLSYSIDTIFYANEVNKYASTPKRWQFDFLRASISKKKRFNKWAKKDVLPDDLAMIQQYYGYSKQRAIEALDILTADQIELIRNNTNRGGSNIISNLTML